MTILVGKELKVRGYIEGNVIIDKAKYRGSVIRGRIL